jgi:hypothetical protein
MHFPIEFLLLGLVGEGSRWIGNKGWLPPKESGMPFRSRGKVGYLDADGKPALDEGGKPLSAKQKAAIMKREEEMKAKEMGLEVKPEEKAKTKKDKGEKDKSSAAKRADPKDIPIETKSNEAKPSTVASGGSLADVAKAAGVKGVKANSKESVVNAKVVQHIAARKAEQYLAAGKKSDLPQYKSLSNKDVGALAASVASDPFSVDVRGGWVFNSRGKGKIGDQLVKAGLMEPDSGNYKHRLTPVGREFVQSVLQTQYRDMSQKQLMEELSALG